MDDRSVATRRRIRADAAERAMRAWSMRVRGESWQYVADELGYRNDSNAIRAVRRYFGRLPEPSRDDLRALWRERHEVLWRIALEDAERHRSGAVRAATALARSAATLDGLDEPTRLAVSSETDERFQRLVELAVIGRRALDLGHVEAMPEADIFATGSVE